MTNQTQLFNSIFEMSQRILLLLSCARGKCMSTEKITALDFITCYSADFNLPYPNLHGENNFKYGELANRRLLVQGAIKDLVTSGLLNVTIDHGYLFSLTDNGKKYSRKFRCDYASDYREITKAAIKKYKDYGDNDLLDIIQRRSLQTPRG